MILDIAVFYEYHCTYSMVKEVHENYEYLPGEKNYMKLLLSGHVQNLDDDFHAPSQNKLELF